MELANLSETAGRAKFFQRGILLNLAYWQDWVKNNANDVAILDQERNGLIRGILFALDLGETAWASVQELISTLSSYMERRGYWEIWHQVLDKALEVAGLIGDLAGMTHLSALLGRLSFQQSHFQESVSYYRQTIRLARQIGDRFNEARACTNLGYYYIEHGQWWRAEVLCRYALQIFEDIDSQHGCAHTENHLGFLYTLQCRWDIAQQHLNQACALWQSMEDQHGLMRGYLNLGGLYVYMEQPAEALAFLGKALSVSQATRDDATIGKIYTNMGIAYRLMADLVKAEEYNHLAETIFKQCSNLTGLSKVWHGLGLTYFYQNRYAEAFLNLENSLDVWRKLGIKVEEIEVLIDLGECEFKRGNRQQALVYLEQVEDLIGQDQSNTRYHYLYPRLEKYRRSLTE